MSCKPNQGPIRRTLDRYEYTLRSSRNGSLDGGCRGRSICMCLKALWGVPMKNSAWIALGMKASSFKNVGALNSPRDLWV